MSTGIPDVESAASSTASRHRGRIRGLFHKLFFSTDRRYQMFQTIVGTTIANLVAAGIIAGIAVAVGAVHVTITWSWSDYTFWLKPVAAIAVLVLGISLLGIVHDFFSRVDGSVVKRVRPAETENEAQATDAGKLREDLLGLLVSVGVLAAFVAIVPFLITLVASTNVSIGHISHG